MYSCLRDSKHSFNFPAVLPKTKTTSEPSRAMAHGRDNILVPDDKTNFNCILMKSKKAKFKENERGIVSK